MKNNRAMKQRIITILATTFLIGQAFAQGTPTSDSFVQINRLVVDDYPVTNEMLTERFKTKIN
jgi:hypothetical protein